jgi:hypothetical protein
MIALTTNEQLTRWPHTPTPRLCDRGAIYKPVGPQPVASQPVGPLEPQAWSRFLEDAQRLVNYGEMIWLQDGA